MRFVQYDLEIPFYDVDAYRIVWHGNYPKYFEVARCQLLEEIGFPYEKMEEEILTKAQSSQVAVKMPDEVTQFQSPRQLIDAVEAWLT